jgi:hypothetical protein
LGFAEVVANKVTIRILSISPRYLCVLL